MAFFAPAPFAQAGMFPNVAQYDFTRQQLLDSPLQTPLVGARLPPGSTYSSWRVRPNMIHHWDDFAALVIQYNAQTVTQADKLTRVCFATDVSQVYLSVSGYVVNSESRVKAVLDKEPVQFHEWLTTTLGGQPITSDVHSSMQKHDPALRTCGWSDYIFLAADGTRPTVMMEGKNPWKVTPTSIAQVLDGTAPVEGHHAGRLAVEQVYGYMYHNQVELGIISTAFGWVFLRRQDQGQLYMTQMLGCHPGIAADFTIPQGFTIMQALYFFSRLAEVCPPLIETTGAQPGFIYVDRANTERPAAAPQIEIRQDRQFVFEDPAQWYQQPMQPQYVLEKGTQAYELIFESWNPDKRMGQKTWLCDLLFPENKPIVIKIWDSFKNDASTRDREVAAYMKLQSLWGKVIPTFIAAAPISIFHSLMIEYVEGSNLSTENWTPSIEQKLRDALAAIHDLGMIHGDIRLENILVGKDEMVWFLDFETAFSADSIASVEAREAMFREDRGYLNGCFNDVRPQES